MKRFISIVLLGALVLKSDPGLGAQEIGADGPREDAALDRVLVYRLEGVLDEARVAAMREKIDGWLAREPTIKTILLSLHSPGTRDGALEPARRAARYLEGLRGVRVVVLIGPDHVAGNASALLALAAADVVMAPGSQLGFWPADKAGASVEVADGDEKAAAEASRVFEELASKRGTPVGRSHLAKAMVSKHHPPIYKVRFKRQVGNNAEEEIRFLTPDEIHNIRPQDKQFQERGDVLLVAEGQRLTLEHQAAREYGFTRKSVESEDVAVVLNDLGIPVGPENVIDDATGGVMKPLSPGGQTAVDFLTHPVVRFFLILAGVLGLLVEFKLPGTLVPSLSGLACFAVFFIAGLFKPSAMSVPPTSVYEALLFVVGLGLLSVELLLLPGVLLFGLSGAAACLISLVLAMVPPGGSGSGSMDYKEALGILVLSSGTSASIFFLILRFLPHSRFLDKSGIVIHSSIQGTPTADSAIEAQTRMAALLGRTATTLTMLRPAGAIDLDGERLDVVAEGDFVEKGEKVQIIGADGTRIVVRKT